MGYEVQKKNGFWPVRNGGGRELAMADLRLKEADGSAFQNLSGAEWLLPYEDWRLSGQDRASDLDNILSARKAMGDKPVIVVLQLHNPAVVSEFEEKADGILAHFGVENRVLMEILSGESVPGGRLPMLLPASMETVERHCEDVENDMQFHVDAWGNPYDYGFGLEKW